MTLPLIIEYIETEEELSTGLHVRLVPSIRVIYFQEDEDTGARSVYNIISFDLADTSAAFAALHNIDWFADFEHIRFVDIRDNGHGTFAEIPRMDMSDTYTALKYTSYMFHMLWAHAKGYVDYEGSIVRDPKVEGKDLIEAYKAMSECDHGPYLTAGCA